MTAGNSEHNAGKHMLGTEGRAGPRESRTLTALGVHPGCGTGPGQGQAKGTGAKGSHTETPRH